MSLLAPSEPNIVRDPPPELPTTVDPIIVYSAPASSTSLAGVQITGFRNTAAGTVPASLFNAAQVAAANYIRDHVHVNVDLNNPQEKALADAMIDALFYDIATAAANGTSKFTDALGNKYTGADLVKLIKNVDFNIYGQASALAAGVNAPSGGFTKFTSWADITSHAEVTFDLGKLSTTLSGEATDHGAAYAIAHELGHALPAGHQIAQQDWQAVKAANPGLQGQALYNAWEVSSQRADSEAFANTLGHEITTFVGGSWLQNSNPGGGYWHGIM